MCVVQNQPNKTQKQPHNETNILGAKPSFHPYGSKIRNGLLQDLNCIQEGLIPTKYFHKSTEILSAANQSPMQLKYEIPKAHVCQNSVCFKTSFVLIKKIFQTQLF